MKLSGGKGLAWAVLGLLLAPVVSGCASQKQLRDYQDEVRVLRQERSSLNKENRTLRMQLESYEVALAEANTLLSEQPEPQAFPELDALGIGYGTRGGNVVISIPASITFASGKATLSSNGKDALKTVAATLSREYPGAAYWIEGHTDSDPISKSKWESNRELSVERAMEVLHYLVEQCGLSDETCVVAGHGEYMPVAPNDTRTNKAQNRRVEIVVHQAQG